MQALIQQAKSADCHAGQQIVSRAFGWERVPELNKMMHYRGFKAGDEVMRQDGSYETVAVVVSGRVKLTRILCDGRRQVVGFLGDYDIIGSIFSERSYENAECVTDSTICFLQKGKFNQFLETHGALAHRLLVKTSNDLGNMRKWMVALARKSAKERVAMFIYWMWEQERVHYPVGGGLGAADTIYLPFTRQDIADFLGLTIETVSRSFTKLRAEGVIEVKNVKKIIIRDLENLRDVACCDD